MIEYLLGDSKNIQLEKLTNQNITKFTWPKDKFDKALNEKIAMPFIIQYIKSIMNLFDKNAKFEIHNISSDTGFNLEIPFNQNKSYIGRPDAIIVPKWTGEYSLTNLMRVLFEFKTEDSIKKKSTQYILETLAASIEADNPVLLVQTDLKTFRMIVLRDQCIKEVYYVEKENTNLAFQFISYWLHSIEKEDFDVWKKSLHIHKSIANKIKENQNNGVHNENYRDNYFKSFTTLTHDDLEYCKKNKFTLSIDKIENSYFKNSRKLKIEGRSGHTYKIFIDGYSYALKLYCIDDINDDILKEMKNEKFIYQYLGESDYWPRLAYAGLLFNELYYGICTSFIKGICYSSSKVNLSYTLQIKENCIKALKELHAKDVIHKDIRFSNFIIKDNYSAVIIDFGFSIRSDNNYEKLAEINLLEGSFNYK